MLLMITITLLQTANQKIHLNAFSQNVCNSFTVLYVYNIMKHIVTHNETYSEIYIYILARKCLVGCFEKKINP